MRVLRVEFENLLHFRDGRCCIDFVATDRVMESSELYRLSRSLYTQNTIAFVGLNATGKTTMLRLLSAALQIVVHNRELGAAFTHSGMIQDGTLMRVLFFHDHCYYLLESVIGVREADGNRSLYYKEEVLTKRNKAQIRSKKDLENFQEKAEKEERRSELGSALSYLKNTISIVLSVTRDNDCSVHEYLMRNHVNIVSTLGETPCEVLEIFDESIELFSVEVKGEVMHGKVKFKDSPLVYDTADMLQLNNIVSAGTIKGQGIIRLAASALQTGGYLLVDELEAHLNKELVRIILGLFKEKKTNPNGACLIFSTHYAELLDYVERKDNIYIARKKGGHISISKYADEFKRNDVKKSEVFLSNLLKGTAPSYEKIQRMRESICKL